MSIEAEVIAMEHSVNRMATALEALTDQMARQNEINQKILEVLIDVMVADDGSGQPMVDMDGNPV